MQVSLKICISQSSEPPLVHLLHKFLSDAIAGGIADDGVDVAVRANGRGLLGRYIVGDFRGWEDTTTGETAALLRQLYLRPVAETGVLRQLKLKFINELSRMRVMAWRDPFSIISIFLLSRLLVELVVLLALPNAFDISSTVLLGLSFIYLIIPLSKADKFNPPFNPPRLSLNRIIRLTGSMDIFRGLDMLFHFV